MRIIECTPNFQHFSSKGCIFSGKYNSVSPILCSRKVYLNKQDLLKLRCTQGPFILLFTSELFTLVGSVLRIQISWECDQ